MSYPQSAFDSDTCCWRELSASQDYLAAATLLTDYLKHGNARNKHSLRWHAGQMYAMAGDDSNALKYFRKTSHSFSPLFGEDARAWHLYVMGTIAFLRRDRRKLDAVVKRWESKLPREGNYAALIKLQHHWVKSYGDVWRAQ